MKKIFSIFAAVLFAGSMMADNFVLVTDASTLAAGDQIIITDVNAAAAISTLQKSNNRGVTTVALTDGVIVPGENVQIITLVAAEANFMLQVGEDAYLYAASNSSNYLKTANAETVGDNGKFAISIASGVASVTAQGTNSRNDLRYNASSSCFSCYGSSSSVEAGLKIFKKQGGDVPPVEDDCNWDEIDFLGNGSGNAAYTDRFKICAGDPAPASIVNIQSSFGTEPGIYVTFPSAEFGAISLDEDQYAIQGAGMLLYVSAFLYDAETEVTVVCQNVEYTLTVKNVNPETAPVVIAQYEVAEAIAAGLAENDEIEVRGIITRMEMKGKNFAKYGSVNIYVEDATGAEGEFEFFNCYSLAADTFKTTVPAYDASANTFANVTEVTDKNGLTIHVGDTVIAHGNYTYYTQTSMHELKTGCYLVYAKTPGAPYPTDIDNTAAEQKAIKVIENGQLFIIKNGVRYDAQGAVVR